MSNVITNNSNSSHVDKKQRKDSKVNKVSELQPKRNGFISGLLNGLYSSTQFILNNPAKVLTLGLVGQVVSSSALGNFQGQASSRTNNSTDLLLLDKPHLNESLALIEQRIGSSVHIETKQEKDKVINFKISRRLRQLDFESQRKDSNNNVAINRLKWLKEDINDFSVNLNQTAGSYQVNVDTENRLHILIDRLDSLKENIPLEYIGELEVINKQLQSLLFPLNDPKITDEKDAKELANSSKQSRNPRQSGVGPQPPNENAQIMTNLSYLQEDVNDLKNRVDRVTNSGASLADVLRIKNEAESRIATLTARLDNIKRGVSQKHSVQIDAINQQVQGLQSQLNSINTALLQKIANIEGKLTEQDKENARRREADRGANKQRAIQDCIAAIKDGSPEQANTKWQHIIELDTNKHWFKEELEHIIREAYGSSLSNFNKVEGFITRLPLISQSAVGYKILIEGMKQNGQFFTPEMVRVGYRIKEYMDMSNYSNIGQEYKNIYDSLKSGLPEAVRHLLWRKVCLRNTVKNNEYLYSANNYFKYDDDRSRVFTWRSGYPGSDAVWKFETYDQGKTFEIKNNYRGQYLYAAGDDFKYDDDRRQIFTWRNGNRVQKNEWRVELLTTDGSKDRSEIALWNDFYGETLYAAGDVFKYDDDRRRVFTWIPKTPLLQARWKIEDCGSYGSRKRRDLSERFTVVNAMLANEKLDQKDKLRGVSGRNLVGTEVNSNAVNNSSELSFLKNSFGSNLLFFGVQRPQTALLDGNAPFSNLSDVGDTHLSAPYQGKLNTTLSK